MGRKIPGRKHRGVKDPEKQKAVREESLKFKVNAPPSNPDDQEMPKSIVNLMRLKELAKKAVFKPKKKKKGRQMISTSNYTTNDRRLPGMKRPDKVMPSLTQLQGESDDQFMQRVNEATETIIKEVEFEQQFGVNVKRNQKSGAIEGIENAKPDEFEVLAKANLENQKTNKRKKKNKKLKADQAELLTSKERRKAKEKERKEERMKDIEEKHMLKDHVKFGEVVHQPPKLTARPRNAANDPFGKPAKRNNLLLSGFFTPSASSKSKSTNLSMCAKQKQEALRLNVVEAYRNLKAQKNKS
ncbi:coiled-coil domain-containing protein 137 [Nilaparvata lugens]|uniref:coiled-coil domain-containing protein 137 n=1 Tax=Nilaparvata lugens TaxID=108931 RepID=UPI00193D0DE5|nr:coiled-coil domain-containing protein 137 [Nilaparvata lugens]